MPPWPLPTRAAAARPCRSSPGLPGLPFPLPRASTPPRALATPILWTRRLPQPAWPEWTLAAGYVADGWCEEELERAEAEWEEVFLCSDK